MITTLEGLKSHIEKLNKALLKNTETQEKYAKKLLLLNDELDLLQYYYLGGVDIAKNLYNLQAKLSELPTPAGFDILVKFRKKILAEINNTKLQCLGHGLSESEKTDYKEGEYYETVHRLLTRAIRTLSLNNTCHNQTHSQSVKEH